MEKFMWKAGNTLAEMRIIVDGTIGLFDEPQEHDTLETALYNLKDRILSI